MDGKLKGLVNKPMQGIEFSKKDKTGLPVEGVPKADPGKPQRPHINMPQPEQPKHTPGRGRILPSSG